MYATNKNKIELDISDEALKSFGVKFLDRIKINNKNDQCATIIGIGIDPESQTKQVWYWEDENRTGITFKKNFQNESDFEKFFTRTASQYKNMSEKPFGLLNLQIQLNEIYSNILTSQLNEKKTERENARAKEEAEYLARFLNDKTQTDALIEVLNTIPDKEDLESFLSWITEKKILLTNESIDQLIHYPLAKQNLDIVRPFVMDNNPETGSMLISKLNELEKLQALKNLHSSITYVCINDLDIGLRNHLNILNNEYHLTLKQLKEKLNDSYYTVWPQSIKTLPLLYQQGVSFNYDNTRKNTSKGCVLEHFENINCYELSRVWLSENEKNISDVELKKKEQIIKGKAILVLLLQLQYSNMDQTSLKDANRDRHKIINTIRTNLNKEAFLLGVANWINEMSLSQDEKTNDVYQDEITLLKNKMTFVEKLLSEKSWPHAFLTNFGQSYGDTLKNVEVILFELQNQFIARIETNDAKKMTAVVVEYCKDDKTILSFLNMVNQFRSKDKNEAQMKGKLFLSLLQYLDGSKYNFENEKTIEQIVEIIRSDTSNKKSLTSVIKKLVNSIPSEQQVEFLKTHILNKDTSVYAVLSHSGMNEKGSTYSDIKDFYEEKLNALEKVEGKSEVKSSKFGLFANALRVGANTVATLFKNPEPPKVNFDL